MHCPRNFVCLSSSRPLTNSTPAKSPASSAFPKARPAPASSAPARFSARSSRTSRRNHRRLAMPDKDDLDLLLDSALSTYADPGPRAGLEERVLSALNVAHIAGGSRGLQAPEYKQT